MSIQVMNIAAAMGDKNLDQRLIGTGLSGLQRSSSPLSLTQQANSPILSAIAARNANHLAQLRMLSASSSSSHPAGLLASVGQESAEKLIGPSSNTSSGIVSHLRSCNNQAAAAQERRDIDYLLRAKAAVAASVGVNTGNATAWALQNARVLPRSLLHSGNAGLLSTSPRLSSALYPSEDLLSKILRLSAQNNGSSPLGSPYVNKNVRTAGMDNSNNSSTSTTSPVPLYMDCDEESLSEYQCLIRQQMELFEATADDAAASVQGRNKQILPGQVGIRCRHCSRRNTKEMSASNCASRKGSMYFPTKLDRIYQAAQNLSAFHLCGHCPYVPPEARKRILLLRERKSPAGGGKRYWAEGVQCLGVVEDPKNGGLRFKTLKKQS